MFRRPTFLQQHSCDFQARQIARGRLPIWLALLMPLMALSSVFGLTIGSINVLWTLHLVLHPGVSFASKSNIVFPLTVFPAFLGAVAPALMLLNFALARIPPLRWVFDSNAAGVTVPHIRHQ